MKRKRFTKEQIIGTLREANAGGVVVDLCRKHGISSGLGPGQVVTGDVELG